MVLAERLELPRLAALVPKTSVSTIPPREHRPKTALPLFLMHLLRSIHSIVSREMSSRHSRPAALLLRLCPNCMEGAIYRQPFSMNPRCPRCDYDFYPEPGFYLGAMMVPYFFSALVTVPAAILLKVSNVEMMDLVRWLAILYLSTVALLLFYAKTLWLHLELRISNRLKSRDG
jgi:uncharacterized protein (DUF983 family)